MTQFSDQIRLGNAFFTGQALWNGQNPTLNGLPLATAPQDTQCRGVPMTPALTYQMGTASTGLASGGVYTTASQGTGTLPTATGALVQASVTINGVVTSNVTVFDIPRAARITASTNLSTTIITLRGFDGYLQPMTWQGIGPSGNTLGAIGSYVDTTQAFKYITTASFTGLASAGIQIGSSANTFGLPYCFINLGMGLDAYINGSSATVPATWTAGFTPTGTPTASGTDVRGLIALSTTNLPDGTKFITANFIAPTVNLNPTTDDRAHVYGPVPFSS